MLPLLPLTIALFAFDPSLAQAWQIKCSPPIPSIAPPLPSDCRFLLSHVPLLPTPIPLTHILLTFPRPASSLLRHRLILRHASCVLDVPHIGHNAPAETALPGTATVGMGDLSRKQLEAATFDFLREVRGAGEEVVAECVEHGWRGFGKKWMSVELVVVHGVERTGALDEKIREWRERIAVGDEGGQGNGLDLDGFETTVWDV